MQNNNDKEKIGSDWVRKAFNRRTALKFAGVATVTGSIIFSSCKDDDEEADNTNVNLGSGNIGVLNYAYALEQLESAFYSMVVSHQSFSTTFNEEERLILTDIRDNEIIHREFYRRALGDNAIPDLEPNFSTINFGDKQSVLTTAKTFEDTGVAAYNGAGKLLTDPELLLAAGKIVSVEGRHIAMLRNLINPKSKDFAGDDVVDSNGLDLAMMPSEVLPKVQPYIKNKINGNNLPTA